MANSAKKTDLPLTSLSEILTKLERINNSFAPELTKLGPEQKNARRAIGLKRRGFVEVAHTIALKNTAFIPMYISAEELNQGIETIRVLAQLHLEVKKLDECIRNVDIILGNDTYRNALSIHRHLREAAKGGVAGAKSLYQKLKKQFPNVRHQETPEISASGPETSAR